MHHFTAIDALPAVRPQPSTPEPGARISVFASEGKYSPHVLQVTGTAAELLAFAEGSATPSAWSRCVSSPSRWTRSPGRSRRERLPPQDRQG